MQLHPALMRWRTKELEPVETPRDSMSTGVNSFLGIDRSRLLTNRFPCLDAQSGRMSPPMAANLTGKSRLQIGQPDDEPGRAGLAHFPERDRLLAWHAPNSANN